MTLRQIYRRQQAFVFMFGIGIALTGLFLLIFPGNDQTLIAAHVAKFWRSLDHTSYMLAGTLLAFGILRTSPMLEAGGHVLASALFLAALIATYHATPTIQSFVGAASFILPLTVGSLGRAYLLIRLSDRSKAVNDAQQIQEAIDAANS